MNQLQYDLDGLRRQVADMGSVAEEIVAKAVALISEPDNPLLVDQIQEGKQRLDELQEKIDGETVRALSRHRPAASDLRFLLSVARVNAQLERIGDHAVNMSEAVQTMVANGKAGSLPKIGKMAGVVRQMVGDALDSLIQRDVRRARLTIARDNMVDAVMDQVIGELLGDDVVRAAIVNDRSIAREMAQLLITRSLERIGDHATNICKEVVFMVHGIDIRHHESPQQVIPRLPARAAALEPAV